jgi:zinc transporter ZupT
MVGSIMTAYGSNWIKKHSTSAMSFSAGILLGVSFLRIIPEAQELADSSVFAYVIAGFLFFYILENIVKIHPCADEACKVHEIGVLSTIGFGFHSLIDGIAIAVVFTVNFNLGIILTLAVLFHKLSDGIVITSLLLLSGEAKKRTILISLIVACLTPLGALIFTFLIKNASLKLLGSLLGAVAGMFVYLSAADLIPQTHSSEHKANVVILVSGVLLIVIVSMMF